MPFSLLDKLADIPLVFVDVETTGASTDYGDRVTEIGIVRIERGQRIAEYQQLVDPQRRISAGVIALTGITQEMVTGQPLFADIRPRVIELMSGAVVIGHNVRFDLSFIDGECPRTAEGIGLRMLRPRTEDSGLGSPDLRVPGESGGNAPMQSSSFTQSSALSPQSSSLSLTPSFALLGHAHVMDTVRIARRRFGRGGNALQRLAPRLGIAPTAAHRALADAITTALVFERLLEPVGGWSLCLCDAFQQQGGAMSLRPTTTRENALPFELLEAIEQQGAVHMEYIDSAGELTQRTISPRQVRRLRGEMVLIAHCHLRNEHRHFKVDRIVRFLGVDEVQPPAVEEIEPKSEEVEPRSHEEHEAVSEAQEPVASTDARKIEIQDELFT